eukprot:tig00001154_g7295.t1
MCAFAVPSTPRIASAFLGARMYRSALQPEAAKSTARAPVAEHDRASRTNEPRSERGSRRFENRPRTRFEGQAPAGDRYERRPRARRRNDAEADGAKFHHERREHDTRHWSMVTREEIEKAVRVKDFEGAFSILESATQRGIANEYHYNTLLDGLCRGNELPRALLILDEMVSGARPVRPDTYSFSTVIRSIARAAARRRGPSAVGVGDLRRVLASMAAAGLPAEIRCENAAINALYESGMGEEAEAEFASLAGKGLAPDVVTFSTVIKGRCRSGRLEWAQQALAEMRAAGIAPNEVIYATLVGALAREGRMAEARAMKEEMEGSVGVPPDSHVFAALINGYAETGDIARAHEVFESALPKLEGAEWEDAQFLYACMMKAYCRAARLAEAEALLDELEGRQGAGVVAYNTLVAAHGAAGDARAARAAMERMKSHNIAFDRVTYSALVKAHSRAGEMAEARRVMAEMERAGVPPDVQTYTSLLSGYCRGDDIAGARAAFEEMKGAGIQPDRYLARVLRQLGFSESDPEPGPARTRPAPPRPAPSSAPRPL